jgi:hypothetical protein
MLPLWILMACSTPQKGDEAGPSQNVADSGVGSEEPALTMMSPVAQLTRVSMALRGVRPSQAELDSFLADPGALESLAQAYVNTPEFAQTVRDMYAEALLVRKVSGGLPAAGAFDGFTRMERERAMSEEALALIETVVMNDMPFTEVVTADWTVLDEAAATMWADHTYDFEELGEQVVDWTDGRPSAGVLTTNSMLVRWESAGGNYNRGRANMVSRVFLCESFAGRDIPIDGSVDLSDPLMVADAVQNNAACVACHQALDPVAAHFWGHRMVLTAFSVLQAEAGECENPADPCYPIAMYSDAYEDYWETLDLRPPSFYGDESEDMGTLGEKIAADPRFAQCQAKRFAGYLTQREVDSIPFDEAAVLQDGFQSSGFDAKALAVSIVTSPTFLARAAVDANVEEALPGVQLVRPEQLDRMVNALTGFRFIVSAEGTGLGDVPMLGDDILGLRAMAGGIDGLRVTRPTHTPTPNRLMVLGLVAEEAANTVVATDLAADPADRLLLADWTGGDEDAVRTVLVSLHTRILREQVAASSPEVDASYRLWLAALTASGGDEAQALTTLVAAFLQSPDVLYY